MHLTEFQYHKPKTIEEACRLLELKEKAAVLAGGTDVLVEIKKGLRQNNDLVSLSALDELKEISKDESNLYIGAGATHNAVKNSPLIKNKFQSISEAASLIGTEQIRNTGTIGGNLCTGASCCDMAPVLIAYNANIELVSLKGKRTEALKDFFRFHKETMIEKGEIMIKVIVPVPGKGVGIRFEKFGLRESASISVASASAFVKVEDGKCVDSRIVIGAVAPIPMISEKASKVLNGTKVTELSEGSSVLKEVGEAAAVDSLPLDDIRGTADFRKDIIIILIQRAVLKAVKRAINLKKL